MIFRTWKVKKPSLGRTIKFSLIIFYLALVCVSIYYFPEIYEFFSDQERLHSFLDRFGVLSPMAFILLQVFQVLFAPIPGEFTGFLGGFIYGNIWGAAYSTVGLIIGSLLAFSISRAAGKPFIEKFIPTEIIEKYDTTIRKKADLAYFYMFLIPGFPKDYLCFLLGLAPMGYKEFLVISTFGRLLGTVALTLQGSFLRQGRYKILLIFVVISAVVLIAAYIYRSKIENFIRKKYT